MVIADIISGNLLDAKEIYICHQCNCVTKTSYGLSKSISNKYVWADLYRIRSKNKTTSGEMTTPGTIIKFEHPSEPDNFHKILCFMSQIGPKKPDKKEDSHDDTQKDTYENRKKWFQECLDIMDKDNYEYVAMPYGIGCGLAGGKWSDYTKMLEECQTKIVLYKLSN